MATPELKVLFAHHRWWYPAATSGADVANHELARALKRRGATVCVLGSAPPGADKRIRDRTYDADGVSVLLVSSDFHRRLRAALSDRRPHVLVTSYPDPDCTAEDLERMVAATSRAGVPLVVYVHQLDESCSRYEPIKDALAAVVTNSRFMAERVGATWGKPVEVVYPVPDHRGVKAGACDGPFITFFNPTPAKGLSVAHNLAASRMQGRPFLFVEGFIDTETHGISLVRSGNLVHARKSPDVATIYGMTRTLIVPSQWEEPFGRVALEAMYNRIPVIASRTGGLVESVGDGGVLVNDYSSVEAWAEAICALDDQKVRKRVIDAGTAHVEKFSLDAEVEKLEGILRNAAGI
ncbi:MAG: glycosyltransferase family 4 protein [Deltaproteobacteria bacterium]|nr:glycosyltransferase family 4 protein [Deltaproteobacteria bacterium]